jgi:hypothetical protein
MADAVEKVFLYHRAPNFKSRWRANEKIIWGDSSSGDELTGNFRSPAESPLNGDRRLFCLSAGN